MIKKNFDATKMSLRELLCGGATYTVPSSRIRYHWIEEDWKCLWDNLAALLGEDETFEHYMGTIVIIPSYTCNETFSLMDGRQRLTTLTIIILSMIEHLQKLIEAGFDSDNNERRIEYLNRCYIVNVDHATLTVRTKIVPDIESDDLLNDLTKHLASALHVSNDIVPDREDQEQAAHRWFLSTIQERFGYTDKSGTAIAEFAESLADRVCFTVISVTDVGSAFSVQTTQK